MELKPRQCKLALRLEMTSASEDEVSHLLQMNNVNVLVTLIYYKLFHYFTSSKMSLKL